MRLCNFEDRSGQLKEAVLGFKNYPKLLKNGLSQNGVSIRRDEKDIYCSSTSCSHNKEFSCRHPIVEEIRKKEGDVGRRK